MPGQAIINKEAESRPTRTGRFSNTSLSKKDLVKRAGALEIEGSSWLPTWKDISTYEYPTKGFFYTTTPNQGSKIDHKTLIDEEATLCTDTFAAGMTSGFTSPSRPWFELFLEDKELMEYAPVRMWLDEVRNIMLDIFQKSNTYTILTSMYTELSTFATACAYVGEDYKNVIHLRSYTAGEYYLGCDASGRVNAFYHKFWMKVGQMVEEFGIENCSPRVQQAYYSNTPDTWIKIHHLIEENNDRIPFLADYSNMPFRSVYWEDGTQEDNYLRLGGYEEFPLITPRWDIQTMADAYGRGSPGWKALGSVKELQKKVKNLLIALDKKTNPPLQADASVIGEVNTLPSGITRFSAQLPNAGVKPTYQVELDIADLDLSIEKTKEKIRKFFFTDLFLMMVQAEREGREITATEIVEKQSERLSILGPILERWQGDDFIKHLIERTFNIGLRKNVFPEPPEELAGRELKIRYTSILAQAQRMAGIVAIDQWVSSVLAVAEAYPNIIDNINFDELAKEKAKMLGIPAKIQNSPEAIAAMRKAREKLAVEADAQKKALILAEAASKGAGAVKDMGQTPMGQNSALDATLASVTGGK